MEREQEYKQKLTNAHGDREKFKEEINELERLVSNQLSSSSQDFFSIHKQLEDAQHALQREKSNNT